MPSKPPRPFGPRTRIRYRATWAIVCLLALGLALYRLDAQSLWYDEAVSARLASRSIPDLVRWTAGDIQPPLYYVILHIWQRLAGRSEWALRFPSVWWGVLGVVLMGALASRLTRDRRVGLVAATMLALAPWWVYYSQEARMYTQWVTLTLAFVYALLRLALSPGARSRRSVALLAGLALALMYTHYFALLVLGTLALWHVGTLRFWKTPARPRLRLWAQLALAVGVGYAAWMPFLWHRFREDASYWQGRLKLAEALRHWAVHMTLGAPETFLEKDAVRWLPLFGLIALLALGLLGATAWRYRHHRPALGLLLLWGVGPALAILILAYRNPKFNPRYLMAVYPAWVVLLAWGLRRVPISWVRGLGIGLVLALFLRADIGWFTDPAFTKPDFRGALAYIRAHRQADEVLVLVSGHMSPVVDYYAADIPYVRLPDIDVLDVRQVLGFDVGQELNQALRGASGAWLLLWQDNVVDPMGVVPYLLGLAGEETPTPNAFWHVRVRHFRLRPGARIPEHPPIARPMQVNWGNAVTFLGYTQEADGALTLFFQAQKPLDADYRLRLELLDEAGLVWGTADARPGPYLYPTFRWAPNQVVMGRHPLPAWPGTPAGRYTLRLRLYTPGQPEGVDILDAQGAPQGRDLLLPDVWVHTTRPAPPDASPPPLPGNVVTRTLSATTAPLAPVQVRWSPPDPWEPGQRVTMQIVWAAARPPHPDDRVRISLRLARREFSVGDVVLAERPTPADNWPPEGRFFTQVRWRVPRDIPPGTPTLVLTWMGLDPTRWNVGEVTVRPSQRRFTVPPVQYPVDATFGGRIRLVGVDIAPDAFRPGATVTLTVTWQALTEMERSYTGFVHLLGPDGRVIAQDDHVPHNGAYPTDTWLAGEVVQDTYRFRVPDPLPEGPIVLEIGWYDALRPGMPRLPLTAGGTGTAVRLTLPR